MENNQISDEEVKTAVETLQKVEMELEQRLAEVRNVLLLLLNRIEPSVGKRGPFKGGTMPLGTVFEEERGQQ